jgi:hypothetical protein
VPSGVPLGVIAAARPSGGGGGPTVPNFPSSGGKIDTWRENFTSGSPDAWYTDKSPSGWTWGSGTLTIPITTTAGGETWFGRVTAGLDMTASSVYVEVPSMTLSGGTYKGLLMLWQNSANNTEMGVANGNMVFYFRQGGASNDYAGSAIAYNATNHRWWRVSVSGTTMTYETSPDKSTWSNPFGVTRTLSGTWYQTIDPYFDVTTAATGGTGSIVYDNVNN